MRVRLICVGKLKQDYWRAAQDDYVARIARYRRIEVIEVPDQPAADRLSAAQEQQVVDTEGAALLARIAPNDHVVVLDRTGRQCSSEEFAGRLERYAVDAKPAVAFVIGGSLGLAAAVTERADERLGLSAMTLPHRLARVVILEQIYRALKIARNEPYHK